MGWFDQQRPNIPSTVRSAPAPIPGGGYTLPGSIGEGDQRVHGSYVPGQEAPIGYGAQDSRSIALPSTGAPNPTMDKQLAPGASPSPAGSLAGYTGAPININVPFNPQSFVGSDAYNFTRDEGLDALSKYHFANGTAGAGGFSKDVLKYASGNAANFWEKQLAHDTDIATGNANRTLSGLSSMAERGLNAGRDQAGYGMEAGNAAAGGTVGQANAMNYGVAGAANSLAEYFAKRRAAQQQPTTAAGSNGTQVGTNWSDFDMHPERNRYQVNT